MRWFILALGLLAAAPAAAVQPDEMLDDPALEARARHISKDLRCLVCRNENIDDSGAGLAKDLRLLVRERISAGDSDEETVAYIVDRYGEFVLLKPRMSGGNLVIWLAGPALLLAGGVGAALFIRRQRGAPAAPAGLSEEEAARLAELTRE
ncbi:cytochrome c-type biogenesis protein CcmH [Pikeienuella piscinae]|uniref:Cytochrome c-type biogenesis protein n=1 Tax=Pikeienuella piscinae TaxID=2748098 RepID=A0A7L5BT17_9RHOB|nr:cytochrome c-type biogenesis protein [Pikeienuella piscinae]QIE54920.1 cytochrome c-type biogenesis protein CcmH [Pikeienuella piscinae]